MLFNSLEFILFLVPVFLIYWFILNKNFRVQNLFLLVGSYFFYGWWDWKFLLLIAGSSLIDFIVSNKIENTAIKKKKRRWLILSLIVNLGALFVFKYFNFFIESFSDLLVALGFNANVSTLNLILPVGISFYTFQTLSYSIDVYRGKLKPSDDWIEFFGYVSFFPQLVAGPIERATNLLPQFSKVREFKYHVGIEGLKLILWGLFKKVVVADNAAVVVNDIFKDYGELSSPVLIFGAVLFSFQIYGDFSGYSDIAIGVSKLFGFDIKTNFRKPYFSRDIAEFWRKWHISLSTWFRDYLYIPLGGSKKGKWGSLKNTMIIFLVSGFWHGANWTFVFWGGLNALFFIPLLLIGKNRKHIGVIAENSYLPTIREFISMMFTFSLVCLGWVFFRSESISHAFSYLEGILNFNDLSMSLVYFKPKLLLILFILIIIDWMHRKSDVPFIFLDRLPQFIRYFCYFVLVYLIIVLGRFGNQEFIYFQF